MRLHVIGLGTRPRRVTHTEGMPSSVPDAARALTIIRVDLGHGYLVVLLGALHEQPQQLGRRELTRPVRVEFSKERIEGCLLLRVRAVLLDRSEDVAFCHSALAALANDHRDALVTRRRVRMDGGQQRLQLVVIERPSAVGIELVKKLVMGFPRCRCGCLPHPPYKHLCRPWRRRQRTHSSRGGWGFRVEHRFAAGAS